jgi:hypothetical protein
MVKTFDIVLNYYDTPELLRNWLFRLRQHSDIWKFANRAQMIIADSGTPLDKLDESLKVYDETFRSDVPWKCIYLRLDSDEVRKTVDPQHAVKMQVLAYNMAILDYSTSDLIIVSNVGNIISPGYFNGHLVEHIKNDRVVCLPKRFDLFSDTYHTEGYKLPWYEVIKGSMRPSGGLPDLSVRRQWYVESGGWDEWYKFISPFDMDMCSRLTGCLDNGMPSELLFPGMPPFKNMGLEFVQPYDYNFFSLVCNDYGGHSDFRSGERIGKRKYSYDFGIEYYKANWSKIKRNEGRVPLKYEILRRNF